MSKVPPGHLAISKRTRTEFASLLARRERMNELSSVQVREVNQVFGRSLRAFRVIPPTTKDFRLTSDLLLRQPALGLRNPDALHLAIAVNHALPVYTLDKGFIRAALKLGYPASSAGLTG